jgi:hypothetical protein
MTSVPVDGASISGAPRRARVATKPTTTSTPRTATPMIR